MKRFFLLILILYLFLFATPSFAQEEILILFDSSVSMMEKLNNEPKYVLATKAAKNILQETDSNKKIGLRIIGIQLNENILRYLQNPSALCTATELVNPIKSDNIENISQSLDLLVPLGTTPLKYSLELAIRNDFNRDAKLKHIILITDGAESCDQDPCGYIKTIAAHRKDIKIDIIAINVSGNDLSQLQCIASAARGVVKPVISQIEIDSALKFLINTSTTQLNNSAKIKQELPKIRFKNYMFETWD